MIVVYYSDESLGEYSTVEEAEKDILQNFSDSDMLTTPDAVIEQDDNRKEIGSYGCTWSLKLEKAR